MAASVISCGTLHVLCFVSRLSLQHQLSAFGSFAIRRHFLQLSHDTQLLLDAGSAQTSCAGLARLLAVPESAGSMSRVGGRLARGQLLLMRRDQLQAPDH